VGEGAMGQWGNAQNPTKPRKIRITVFPEHFFKNFSCILQSPHISFWCIFVHDVYTFTFWAKIKFKKQNRYQNKKVTTNFISSKQVLGKP